MRVGFMAVVLALFGPALLGGCTHGHPAAFGAFAADLLGSAAAALLL